MSEIVYAAGRTDLSDSISTRPLHPEFGVEVSGVDFSRPMTQPVADRIRALADEHFLLLFRGQKLPEDQHVALTGMMGSPIMPAEAAFTSPASPLILFLGNVGRNGEHLAPDEPMTVYFKAAEFWHSDGDYKEKPNYLTILHSLEIPPEGGDTWFASMVAACEALPAEMKDLLADRRMEHPYRGKVSVKGWNGRDLPTVSHPVLRPLPDGRTSLFLCPEGRIEALDEDVSHALVPMLFAHATQDRFVYVHKWKVGDTLIWNNRGLIHQAQTYDKVRHRRLLQRTEIGG